MIGNIASIFANGEDRPARHAARLAKAHVFPYRP